MQRRRRRVGEDIGMEGFLIRFRQTGTNGSRRFSFRLVIRYVQYLQNRERNETYGTSFKLVYLFRYRNRTSRNNARGTSSPRKRRTGKLSCRPHNQ
jgi:hypothetical protein